MLGGGISCEPRPAHRRLHRQGPTVRPAILSHVRERVHAVLPEVEEALKWSMPAYTLGGKIVLITAAFKAHMALNFWRGQELRGQEANADAMGQFGKIRSLDELPSDAELDRLIREAAELARARRRRARPSMRPSRRPKCIPSSPRRSTRRRRQSDARGLSALGAARLFRMDCGSEAGCDPAKRIADRDRMAVRRKTTPLEVSENCF